MVRVYGRSGKCILTASGHMTSYDEKASELIRKRKLIKTNSCCFCLKVAMLWALFEKK